MVFDATSHTLGVVAALQDDRGTVEVLDYSRVSFNYGEGVGGRSFKSNQIRVFVHEERSDGPRHYRQVTGVPLHSVLVSFPMQAPADGRKVWAPYGVLNLGSTKLECPLRLIQPDRSEWQSKLSAFKEQADVQLHLSLAQIFSSQVAPTRLTFLGKGFRIRVMAGSQISVGYYAVIPDPDSVTDADRENTKNIFNKVFARTGTDAALSVQKLAQVQQPKK